MFHMDEYAVNVNWVHSTQQVKHHRLDGALIVDVPLKQPQGSLLRPHSFVNLFPAVSRDNYYNLGCMFHMDEYAVNVNWVHSTQQVKHHRLDGALIVDVPLKQPQGSLSRPYSLVNLFPAVSRDNYDDLGCMLHMDEYAVNVNWVHSTQLCKHHRLDGALIVDVQSLD
ncbi:hypothetical protein AeRB84_020118 [Aphanomyces euteiches]|nr:hypothetical protein AeRB84_020118 [Aphanomyces euteiches]